jgi:hypothetical protein
VFANSGVFYGGLTVADRSPAGVATTVPSSFTSFALDNTVGALQPNSLQKYAYCDPKVSPINPQQYEAGNWVATATTTVAPDVAPQALFLNRALNTRPFDWGSPLIGTFTTVASPATVVVPCAGITVGSVFRLSLVGGSAAAFAAGIAGPPAITIQVGATTAASTFTVAGTTAGFVYAYEVLRG